LLNLNVEVDGSDLSKSLIHYLPASIPGQYGNISIFGHSSLPQLFNMSDYKTVFTYLPKMTIGDKIYIETKGVTYEYEVFDMFIVKPSEISVLDQKFDNSYLTLVTCVPPGTYKDRLIVRAKIIDK
jgi:sortase A